MNENNSTREIARTLGVLFGSNLFLIPLGDAPHGLIAYESEHGDIKQVFGLRELSRTRSSGSYPVVDCDLRDRDGQRVLKLAKSRPISETLSAGLKVTRKEHGVLRVEREDGSVVVEVEDMEPDWLNTMRVGPHGSWKPPVPDFLIRINGDFFAGPFHVVARPDGITISDTRGARLEMSENVFHRKGPILLTTARVSF